MASAMLACAAACACWSADQPAFAQARDTATATALFTRGRAAAKKGDYDKACPLLEESNRLDPKVGTQLNLADCLEKQKRIAHALETWQAAIQLAESTRDPRAAEATRRAAALEPRVPKLTIVAAPGAPSDITIRRDDIELGAASLGLALPVEPGKHKVVVTALDHQERVFELELHERESKTLQVDVGKSFAPKSVPLQLSPAPDAGSAAASQSSGAVRTAGYVLGGIGIAGLIAGTVTGLMLQQKKSSIADHCDDNKTCDPQGLEAVDSAKGLLTLNTISWAVGFAGVGTGTVLILVGGPSKPADSHAGALPSSLGVQWRGTF